MPKISIVIPNYNNAKYLDRCIKSAINQTHKEIEVICVDDKSTDNSMAILKKYEKLDPRIKLIALDKNGGVSNARNIALKMCDGEYVCFLDSDDYIELTFCKDLLNSILTKKSDLACGGHIKVNKFNQRISKWIPTKDVSNKPNDDIYQFTKHRNVTQKLFKLSIIKENNLTFDSTLNYMEDAVFLVNYLSRCKLISSVKKVLYDVQINFDSLCRNKNYTERRRKDTHDATEAMNKILDSNK